MDEKVECTRKYVFVRQIEETDGGYRPESTFFDTFFCEKCLKTARIQVAHTATYGDGTRIKRHDV